MLLAQPVCHPGCGPGNRPFITARRAISQGSTASAAAAEHFRYEEAELRGFIDTHDERIYAAATARFWTDAQRTRCVPTRTLTPA